MQVVAANPFVDQALQAEIAADPMDVMNHIFPGHKVAEKGDRSAVTLSAARFFLAAEEVTVAENGQAGISPDKAITEVEISDGQSERFLVEHFPQTLPPFFAARTEHQAPALITPAPEILKKQFFVAAILIGRMALHPQRDAAWEAVTRRGNRRESERMPIAIKRFGHIRWSAVAR